MVDVEILVVGVNAYVVDGDELVVYMPNGTKTGSSSATRTLEVHRPTVWQVNPYTNELIYPERLRYFPFMELELEVKSSHDVDDLDVKHMHIPEDGRFPLNSKNAGTTPKTAGKVVLKEGKLSVERKCLVFKWEDRLNPHTGDCEDSKDYKPFPDNAVVNGIRLYYRNVKEVSISFKKLEPADSSDSNKARVPNDLVVDTKTQNKPVKLMIGNVCAEYILAWVKDKQGPTHDVDFEWLWEIAEKPLDHCDKKIEPSPWTKLKRDEIGPEGMIGCECNGIIAKIE